MAVETRTQLKTYFETGDVPTQGQFELLIDSLQHVNDEIRLVAIAADGTLTIPVGKTCNWIGILCNGAGTIKVGTTGAGSENLYPQRGVSASQEISLNVSIWARTAVKTVYITTDVSLSIYVKEFASTPLV